MMKAQCLKLKLIQSPGNQFPEEKYDHERTYPDRRQSSITSSSANNRFAFECIQRFVLNKGLFFYSNK